MAASSSDYFMKSGTSTATTLSAPGYTVGNTSINVASTTNWPTDTGVTFAIDEVDGNGVRISGSYNEFYGVVSGATQLTGIVYAGGDANRDYSAGATTRVYLVVSSYRVNKFTDGVLVEHKQDGKHGDITADSLTMNAGATVDFSESPLATVDVGDDIVTDAKLINGKVLKRQGGHATQWATTGTTNYDMSATDVKIQCGAIGSSAGGDVTITFPTAFTATPVIVAGVAGNNAGGGGITANCFAEVVQVTATTAIVRTFNTGGGQSNQGVSWIAIGV